MYHANKDFKESSYEIATMILFLIVICNTSILNPGPNKINGLSFYYQNLQGLITFNSLGKPFPDLNFTKIAEFQSYIFEFSPDVIVLNETWLKPSIKNKEIIPGNHYKIFRNDRSPDSHPIDPQNPNKFKRNGGGVMIAVKEGLNLNPKLVKVTCKAEVLSVELTLPNKKKICISTLYRVGTLGRDNFSRIQEYYNEMYRRCKYKQIYIIGDLNLESVNWNSYSSSNAIQSLVLELFQDLGLTQLINTPTHIHKNILDILLTDSPHIVHHLVIHDPGEHVKSDHSPISFNINIYIKKKKMSRRYTFNFKKANWINLNNDLFRVDWDSLLNYNDIHSSWECFKTKFLSICEKHIPKIAVKNSFQPPWFDSEVFRLSKKKERFRILYKTTQCPEHYHKYSSHRRELKNIIKSKMRSNFDDELSPKTITKKFWSYVKSCNKTSRLPDRMFLKDRSRNSPVGIANLFNEHFYNQFSESSSYDIEIDFKNDIFNEFDISTEAVYNLLKNLNPNKSPGPDKISGHLLKGCACSIALPLKILFNLSFKTGSLPTEWKLAHIVPVHKKNDKNKIENYRPISLTCIIS